MSAAPAARAAADETLFVNIGLLVTVAGAPAARRGPALDEIAERRGWGVVVAGDAIVDVGAEGDLRRRYRPAREVDCRGLMMTPGLVDSHTHALFGRARVGEHEQRGLGVSYMEIARMGGGIHASVRDLRSRSEDELVALALPRVERLASYGTTTLEIKSGYGLSTDDELKSLRAIARLAARTPVRIVPTWLGAHELPLEFRERADGRREFVDLLVSELLPAVVRDGIARFADVFCEPGVFDAAETRRVLVASRAAGLGIKVHADELEPSGGAELACELDAASADHLGAVSDAGVAALGASRRTVATLLPGTLLFLGRTQRAPARRLVDAGAAVALATDFNPGSSPLVNFPLAMTLAVSQLGFSAAEALVACTANGAAALDVAARTGQIAPGYSADLALWEADDHRDLAYWYGDRLCRGTWARGKACHHFELGLS